MQFDLVTIGIFALLLISGFLLQYIIRRARSTQKLYIRDVVLSSEELWEYAKKNAIEHSVSFQKTTLHHPIPRMKANYDYILSVYNSLNRDGRAKKSVPPAAEWLLDNFYMIEEQTKQIRRDFVKKHYRRLPIIKSGQFQGYARIFAISMELVTHTDGQVTEDTLTHYIESYQSHSVLFDREIWALPVFLKLALIETIRNLCEKIQNTQQQWYKADEVFEDWMDNDVIDTSKGMRYFKESLAAIDGTNPLFIEHLFYHLRRSGRSYITILQEMNDRLSKLGTTTEDVARKVHSMQSLHTVSMGNCVTSLRHFSTFDWSVLFDSISVVDKILRQDPDGTYPAMDVATRYRYRSILEEAAIQLHVSEIHLAKEAVELAESATMNWQDPNKKESNSQKKNHVGYYIIGDGKRELVKRQKGTKRHLPQKKNLPLITLCYILLITSLTLVLTGLALFYGIPLGFSPYPILEVLFMSLILWVPISEIVIHTLHWFICKLLPPTVFPRLSLEEGIPLSLSTIVVIPSLLPDVESVHELLQKMEKHYLSNREYHLYFALLGSYKDAIQPQVKDAEKIVQEALRGVEELNQKYCQEKDHDVFYFFHRKSQYNKKNNIWIGWERKRGALIEFNDLVLSSKQTSFSHMSCKNLPFSDVKYIITLDSDTILPPGTAKKLIATMAHPLHQPSIDEKRGIVTDGYTIMQPRIDFTTESANKSLFSEIFTGQRGIDPYASAISNVYQDLFGEGIYTGKGIYDLKVFQKVLKMALPDNAVLSHDLLEGSFVRTGLVTDLRFMDSYPSSLLSYASRVHRWIRGDWQLLPFLWRRIRNRNGQIIRNPLSTLSKWKMFDNLRRSLITPTLLLVLFSSFSILAERWYVGLIVAFLSIFIPFFIQLLEQGFSTTFWKRKYRSYMPEISGLRATFLQSLLQLILLPYYAILVLHAISLTIARVYITKRNTLQWTAAAIVEKYQTNTVCRYLTSLSVCPVLAIILSGVAFFFEPSLEFVAMSLGFLWITAPFVGYWVSKDHIEETICMPKQKQQELRIIARKTWRFFEEFMNEKNHYLPPDNYQTDPPRGLAYRTSPTNIGLGLLSVLSARDFGFIPTTAMIDRIEKTISTMETIDTWNGHLPNWIDTRTLQSLRPTYISTVDSGNLLTYLITLREGLKEYLHKPLLEINLLQGIRDTLLCAGEEGVECNKDMMLCFTFPVAEPINLGSWQSVIDQLNNYPAFNQMKDNPWKSKVKGMVDALYQEFHEFYPTMSLFKKIPLDLRESKVSPAIVSLVNKLRQTLETNHSFIDLPAFYEASIRQIEIIEMLLQKEEPSELQEGFAWLSSVKESLRLSIQRTNNYLSHYQSILKRIDTIADAMDFKPLYSKRKQLFSIGYVVESQKRTNSFYDLMASEARQTSYACIAKGIVPSTHWFRLDRTLTTVDGYKGLVSWTGTMFEYLMPCLIMKKYKHTLLDESYFFAIHCQKKYAAQRKMPWGASESAFHSLDKNHDYQYKAIGIPWLGLKRGLMKDAVVTPYATFLALMVDPKSALDNLESLKNAGLEGAYGFYEAADYTPQRLTFGNKRKIVKTYMSHHQGMSLVALANFLHENTMQKRFHLDPSMDSASLLLQEKSPASFVLTKDAKKSYEPDDKIVSHRSTPVRVFDSPNPVLPKVHLLSNGSYSIMLTDKGTGYSQTKMMSVTRWREDVSLDSCGMFFYIRNVNTNKCWSATYSPLKKKPTDYQVVFTSDKALYKRVDGTIETQTEVVVTSGEPVEIRRLTFRNTGKEKCLLEITSYYEVVLTKHSDDIAHPCFSNLFVKTEARPDLHCILATRRPRLETDKGSWLAHSVVASKNAVGDVQYETDRMKMIGRGHSVKNPVSIEKGHFLSNSVGAVLDPVMSLRTLIELEPLKETTVSFITIVGSSRESVLSKIQRYATTDEVESAFQLALTRSHVETDYLSLDAKEVELYQNMASHIVMISPTKKQYAEKIMANKKGQSALWRYGISGDKPIVLVYLKKDEPMNILYDILQAYEYWLLMDLKVDLVLLVDEEVSYHLPLKRLVSDIVSSRQTAQTSKERKDIFILDIHSVLPEDLPLLFATARIVLKSDVRSIEDQISIPDHQTPMKMVPYSAPASASSLDFETKSLRCFNGLGGFNEDGTEYQIILRHDYCTPAPWSNVIANPNFGCIVSDLGSAYTWFGNSRENKLTPWSNDVVSDPPGDILYLRDEDTGELWSMTPLPIRQNVPYRITHGFGYSIFEHSSHGVRQKCIQFIPLNANAKICLVTLQNDTTRRKNLRITNYIRPVLGVTDQDTALHIRTTKGSPCNVWIENPYNEDFPGHVAFLTTSLDNVSIMGNRKEFFGSGSLEEPESLLQKELSGCVGVGFDPCAAIQGSIQLEPEETKDFVFVLGMGSTKKEASRLSQRYRRIKKTKDTLTEVQEYWKDTTHKIQAQTPDETMDFMINGWLPYQIISCRLWARSAFYQSGGAFGFRDQLQDCISIAHINPSLCRLQIVKHAHRQFIEGDVQHWWHEPSGKGTRTRITDDRLWLPYATAEYIRITGDMEILHEEIPYLESLPLEEHEEERYEKPNQSQETSTLFEHCLRAIEVSLQFGEHNLPLMGTGDWNDGMNAVGNKGKGESVWLGWFLYSVLDLFIPLCVEMKDDRKANKYKRIMDSIQEAIEKHAWDGNWYRRAYFDNGMTLGSILNKECKIDSIAQSWAVLSGAADPKRAAQAMQSVEDHLVLREDGIVTLLFPPFDKDEAEPGYIKGYIPGVRENGGQYTHAAVWVLIAFTKMGLGNKAWEIFSMLNPIHHTSNIQDYSTYKTEPYVVAADVYSQPPNTGRGGWTWYTGSASWLYRAGLEYILGFQKQSEEIILNPCIPSSWKEYSIEYVYQDTKYKITVLNPEGVQKGVRLITMDGFPTKSNRIPLLTDKKDHFVKVFMGNLE